MMKEIAKYIVEGIESGLLDKKRASQLLSEYANLSLSCGRKDSTSNERLHPLLHENVSDIYVERFSSRFSGEEFFLSDHVVKGSRVLPGVAYLEMARIAASRALGVEGVSLFDVSWVRPLVAGAEGIEVFVELGLLEDGLIGFD